MTSDYNQLSDIYGQTKSNPLRQYVDKFTLLKILGNVQGKSVLDLACGHGHYTRLVKTSGAARVVGVDVSPAMIAAAQKMELQAPLGIDYRVHDVARLDQVGRFDIVLAVYLFPYATTRPQLVQMCRAIYRNLKPGGRLVAATLNPTIAQPELPNYKKYGVNLTAPAGLHDGVMINVGLETPDGPVNLSAHYWSQAAYEQALLTAGFQKIDWNPMQVPAEAIAQYGETYWQTYRAKALDIVLECHKIEADDEESVSTSHRKVRLNRANPAFKEANPMIDQTTPFGQRVTRRLTEERIIWLTTVGPNGTPYPRPVWFWWDGQTFLIYSKPDTFKLGHIGANPNVALNFDGDGLGGDIIVFTGEARLDPDAPPADQMPEYAAKYQPGFERIGLTAAQFAAAYSVPLRVTPTALRGH